jgi:hypothetical protein
MFSDAIVETVPLEPPNPSVVEKSAAKQQMMNSLSKFRTSRQQALAQSKSGFDGKYEELERMMRQNEAELEAQRKKNRELVEVYEKKDKMVEDLYTNRKKIARVGGFSNEHVANLTSWRPGMPPIKPGPGKGFPPPAGFNSLIQNQTRNMDLNDFERALVFIDGQEEDAVNKMLQVPVGTDLYRFMTEQFKESTTSQGEVKKLMMEQMLKAMKKGFDLESQEAEKRAEHLMWDDEQRKNIIAGYLRKGLGANNTMEFNAPREKKPDEEKPKKKKKIGYDPVEGFTVFWDYCRGLPASQNFTNFEYAVVNQGSVMRDLKEAKMSQNIEEDSTSVYSVFAQQEIFKGIEANPETLIIWKVYMPVSEEKPDEITEIGWTQIDPFDITGQLKRGIWKCPLYKLPVDTNVTKESVQQLEPILGAWFYLRISYPWGDEYTNMSLIPEESSHLAEIPEMHMRVVTWRPKRDPVQKPPPEPPAPPPEIEVVTEVEKPPEEPPKPPPPPEPQIDPYKYDRLGCIVEMRKVLKYKTANHMKIATVCFEGGSTVKDDTTMKWIRNTIIHNPYLGTAPVKTDEEKNNEDNPELALGNWRDDQLAKEGKMANLTKDENLVYKEQKFNLYRNLQVVWANNRKHWWLMFQLLERKADSLAELARRAKADDKEADEEADRKKNPWSVVAYAVFRLSTNDFKLREGIHTVDWLKPPILIPPFDETKVEKLDNSQFEFKILRSYYDLKDVDREYKAFIKTAKKKEEDDRNAILDPAKLDVDISNDPFIFNEKKQFQDKIFEKGYGVDFYLDQCRFLPDNVSVTKCIIRVVNNRYKDLFPLKGCLPKFNIPNDSLNPIFDYRTEYRAENFNPTALILITLITIDKAHNEPRIIGYAAINMFINRNTEKQPTEESDSDIVLQNGCYQIPIHCEEPFRVQPFDLAKIEKLTILPCASVLVRIRMAPLSADFKSVLNKNDVPKADWKKLGIWPTRPEYPTRAYNTIHCQIKDDEKRLFMFRDSRAEQPLVEEANILLRVAGINKDMSEKDIFLWLDSQLKINSDTKLLDTRFFAKYLEQAGFKFTVDAIHNLPNNNPYVTTFTLNPPGDYYKDSNLTEMLVFNAEINWKHPIGQILYNDNLYYFKEIPFDPYMQVIIEVKEMIYQADDTFKFQDYGWTVVPIFIGDGYVMNGHYQIPLFAGSYPKEILLEDLKEKKAWETIQEIFSQRKSPFKWKNFSSVLVRIIDGQREGQLNKKLDLDTLDHKYLPEDIEKKTKFAYNQQVQKQLEGRPKLATTIPNNGKPANYNKKILAACLDYFKITIYNV